MTHTPKASHARLVIIDNYDSFTYNTVQLLSVLGAECTVRLNDGTSLAELERISPDGILLSAGPGTPDEAGITLDVIQHFAGRIPLLGVCLGHQAIARAYGAAVVGGGRLLHGKTSGIEHCEAGLFDGLPNPVAMARYNSLLVDERSLPGVLRVTARSSEGEIMGLCHRELAVQGVQFHPESVLSRNGDRLFSNWLQSLQLRRRVTPEVVTPEVVTPEE